MFLSFTLIARLSFYVFVQVPNSQDQALPSWEVELQLKQLDELASLEKTLPLEKAIKKCMEMSRLLNESEFLPVRVKAAKLLGEARCKDLAVRELTQKLDVLTKKMEEAHKKAERKLKEIKKIVQKDLKNRSQARRALNSVNAKSNTIDGALSGLIGEEVLAIAVVTSLGNLPDKRSEVYLLNFLRYCPVWDAEVIQATEDSLMKFRCRKSTEKLVDRFKFYEKQMEEGPLIHEWRDHCEAWVQNFQNRFTTYANSIKAGSAPSTFDDKPFKPWRKWYLRNKENLHPFLPKLQNLP